MNPAARHRGGTNLALCALVGIAAVAEPTAAAAPQVPNSVLTCGGSAMLGIALSDTVAVDTGVAYGEVAFPDSAYWGQRFLVLRSTTPLPADTVVLATWQGSVENLDRLYRPRNWSRRMTPGDTFLVHPSLRDPEHWAEGRPTLDMRSSAFPDLAADVRSREAAARGNLMSAEEAYDFCSLPVDQDVVNSGDWSASLAPMDWAKGSNGAWRKHPAEGRLRGLAHAIEGSRIRALPMDVAGTWSASVSLPSGRTVEFFLRTTDFAAGFPYQAASPTDAAPWEFRADQYQVRLWAAASVEDLPELQAVYSPLPLCRFFMEFVPVPTRDESCLGFPMYWDVSMPQPPGEQRSGHFPWEMLDQALLVFQRDNEFNGLLFGDLRRVPSRVQGSFGGTDDALEFRQEVTLPGNRDIRLVVRRVSPTTVAWRPSLP